MRTIYALRPGIGFVAGSWRRGLIAACIGWLLPAVTTAASFACDKASSAVERSICDDAELSDLDDQLARYFAASREALKMANTCLVADQRHWLRTRRNTCTDAPCLRSAYRARLAELDALQPGASALKWDLPAVPALVWILPAAEDTVAAPPLKNPEALEVLGTLRSEQPDGDGYLIDAANGDKHLVVMSMFIDDATAMLDTLAKDSGATYRVRGQRARDGEQRNFDPGSCRYVYRMPR